MKLHHFINQTAEAQKLRDLGRAFNHSQPSDTITEAAKKPMNRAVMTDEPSDSMDAAIHTLTQDQKHLHKKLAHHD